MFLLTILLALALGNKSLDMLSELEKGGLSEYDPQKELFFHDYKAFHVLTGKLENLSTKPVIYVGSYPLGREIIYFDPDDSPLLENYFASFISLIPENSTTLEILSLLTDYIRNRVFCMEKCNEMQVNDFIYDWAQEKSRIVSDFATTNKQFSIPLISIEEFIQNKMGVCRHQAFVSVYFLDRLITSQILLGKAYLIRDLISSRYRKEGHAWSLFLDEQGNIWHIDPFWNVIRDLMDPVQFKTLCNLYGTGPIERELKRCL